MLTLQFSKTTIVIIITIIIVIILGRKFIKPKLLKLHARLFTPTAYSSTYIIAR